MNKRTGVGISLSVLLLVTLLTGCVDVSPAISKTNMGNLEIAVAVPPDIDVRRASIYVDNIFVGNVSDRLPILYLKRGRHVVRVQLDGLKTYEQAIEILGDPNHQFLNVTLEKSATN